jgi:hypothetical protein
VRDVKIHLAELVFTLFPWWHCCWCLVIFFHVIEPPLFVIIIFYFLYIYRYCFLPPFLSFLWCMGV